MLALLPGVRLTPASRGPMYRQLYDAVRAAVLEGTLARGTRLPPTRELAREMGVSRNTIMLAFEQLIAEGYLEGRVGAGTFVSAQLPETSLLAIRRPPSRRSSARGRRLARRGDRIVATTVTVSPGGAPAPFRIASPDLRAFPFDEWSKIVARLWRSGRADLLMYGDAAGYRPLREAIAAHAGAARAVRCSADQVVVVSGSQHALDLAARVLIDAGDPVWMEDPGYLGARAAFVASGADVVHVPVNAEGIDVAAGMRLQPAARIAYVTPSHQFPLGPTMSLPRRLALLEWASRAGAWVLEDDSDSEYRYAGRPLASLQGLDNDGRVIYIGTFSKVMFPALRLGYAIVPPDLVDAFTRARAVNDRHSPTIEQAAMAEFIESGAFGRHIRRMRNLYAGRQEMLLEAAARELSGALTLEPAESGMHLVANIDSNLTDARASALASDIGVEAAPISKYVARARVRPALLLGYTAYTDIQIADSTRRLGRALSASVRAAH